MRMSVNIHILVMKRSVLGFCKLLRLYDAFQAPEGGDGRESH